MHIAVTKPSWSLDYSRYTHKYRKVLTFQKTGKANISFTLTSFSGAIHYVSKLTTFSFNQ